MLLRGREWALVGAGFVVVAAVLALWMALDRRPPEWDHANHLERAVLCARDLRAGDVRAILERSSFYPPLVLCLAGAASLVMPIEAAAGLVMVAFLGLGMAAVYLLGRNLASEAVGVTAALLFATAPFVVFLSLRFQLDVPLAAMVALGLVALIATENFQRRGSAALFGLVCGLGTLTKPTFGLYVLAPAVLLLLLAPARRRALAGAALAVLVAGAVSLPWLGPRVFGLGAQIDARAFAQAAEAGHPDPLTLAGLTFYPRLLGYQLGLAAAVLVGVGMVVAALRRRWFLLTAVVAPFVVLELIQNKNLRYALPLLGGLALLAALALDAAPARLRRGLVAVLTGLAVAQVSAVTAGVPPNFWVPALATWWVPSSPPERTDWRHQAILTLIERDRQGTPATVSVVPNFDRFSVSNFRYYAVRDGLDRRFLRFVRAWDDPPLGIDYMVLKTGDVGPVWTAEKSRRVAARLAGDPHLARVFPVIGEFPLPDGSTATVRARRVPALTGTTAAAVAAGLEAGLRRRLDDVARDVEGLEVRLVHDEEILGGRVRRAEIHAAAATLGEFTRPTTPRLRVRDLALAFDELLVNPGSAAEGRFDPLDAGRVRLETATVSLTDLQAYVAGVRRFSRSTVSADGDALAVTVRVAGPDVSARVRLRSAVGRPPVLVAEGVRVGGVPVPDALVNWVIRHFDPFPRIASRLPFPVEIGRVTVSGQALRISRER
jgi:hypothetical protein